MATQVSALSYIWSQRVHLAHAAIAEAFAANRTGRQIDLEKLSQSIRHAIATYDESESEHLNSLDLRGIAHRVRDLADSLNELIAAVPAASDLVSLHDELLATGEDLADSSRLLSVPLPSVADRNDWERWPAK